MSCRNVHSPLQRREKVLQQLVGPIRLNLRGPGHARFDIEKRDCASSALFVSRLSNVAVVRTHRDLRERWHGDVFVNFQAKGNLHACEDGHAFTVKPGDVTLLDPLTSNVFWADSQSCFLSLSIPRHEIASAGLPMQIPAGLVIPGDQGKGVLLSTIVRSFFTTLHKMDETAGAAGRGIILQLIREGLEEQWSSNISDDALLLDRMCCWVKSRLLTQKITVDDLARNFGISARSLYRLFRRNNTSPQLWLQNIQLEVAREILRSNNAHIAKIAQEVGFKDASHFTRLFKKAYGNTPISFRAKNNPAVENHAELGNLNSFDHHRGRQGGWH
jgi:AraC-like DNA-binding protein